MSHAVNALPGSWAVPKVFRERVGREAGRQRAMTAEGHLLLILHAPPREGASERHGRFFWRKPEGQWQSIEMGTGTRALESHLAEYSQLLDELDDEVQQATSAEDYFSVMRHLRPLHRAAAHQRTALQQAREIMPTDRDLIIFRDAAEQLEHTATMIHEEAKYGLDFSIARQAEEQARTSHQMAVASHRLNVLVAFFFPLATVSAIFGMNLTHGFEAHPTIWPFALVVVISVVAGFLLLNLVSQGPKTLAPPPATPITHSKRRRVRSRHRQEMSRPS
ncbi:CorA-like Mg2+ transporter protein [Planctomycetes bacterium Pan216]|uniref:CorA-like Mg2+ transporter protein n=1 Tax=Kolteria novifilia TaxID=2527975 RepID=A0A518B9Z2_9BACT|nr:CorA-like Mg2+ transporter protein [Planctomycetes bacterium Pan216]